MKVKFSFLLISFFISILTVNAEISIHNVQFTSSPTATDGKISILIDGTSDGPYNIKLLFNGKLWRRLSGNKGLFIFDNLGVGIYEVIITNNDQTLSGGGQNNCDKIFSIAIENCKDIGIAETHSPFNCGITKEGFIDLTISGGNPPYKYSWNNGKTIEDLYNLEENKTYTVVVTDAGGCSITKSISLEGQKLEGKVEILRGSAAGATEGEINVIVDVTGASGNLDYKWSNNLSPNIVHTGNPNTQKHKNGYYTMVVTSEQGCSITLSYDIGECKDKPITLASIDICSNKYSKEYCYPTGVKCFAVKVNGGNLPVKYVFSDEKNATLLSGTAWSNQNVALPQQNTLNPSSAYTFKVTDQCGNTASLEYPCKCNQSEETFFELFRLTAVNPCPFNDSTSKLKYSDIVGGGGAKPEIFRNRNYTIDWDNFATTEISDIYYNQSKTGFSYTLNGPDIVDVTSGGVKKINIRDSYGCKFDYCMEFSLQGGTQCSYKKDVLQKVANSRYRIEPFYQKSIAKYALLSQTYCTAFPPNCDDLGRKRIEIEDFPIQEIAFVYKPNNFYSPCLGGSLETGDNCTLMYLSNGLEYVDWTNRENGSTDGICVYDCACVFEIGGKDDVILIESVEKWVDNDICSPKTLENDSFEPKNSSSSLNQCVEDNDLKKDCSGGKHFYQSKTTYNDCYFDVTCPGKNGGDLLIYRNCPFDKKCCYVYDDFPNKVQYFPGGVTLGSGKIDLVSFCRWQHQNPLQDPTKDGSIYHVVKVLTSGVCPAIYPSCSELRYSTPLGNKSTSLSEKIKFLQADEVFAEIFPNPFEQTIDIRLHQNKSPQIKLSLYDLLGRLVQNEQIVLNDGDAGFSINTYDNLPKGVYILILEGEGYRLQYPLVHQ